MNNEEQGFEQLGNYLSNLKGAIIDDTEVAGGSKYARRILLMFTNGKTLWIEPEIKVSSTGINATLKYGQGSWGRAALAGGEDENNNL